MKPLEKALQAQDRILEALIICESTIGELYETYMKCQPRMVDFWGGLAEEERIHAKLLETVRADLKDGVLMRGLDHFNQEQVQGRIDFVRQNIETALENPPTEQHAVAVALAIESSIIDSKFFEFAKSDGSAFQVAAHKLVHETHDHIKMVQSAKAALEQLERKQNETS